MKKLMITVSIALIMITTNVFAYGNMGKKDMDFKGRTFHGEIKEVKQTKAYTYLQVQGEKKLIWVAVSQQEVKKGQKVDFVPGKPYTNFPSKALNKTFKELYLVGNFSVDGEAKKSTSYGHAKKEAKSKIKKGSIKKADYIISDIYKKKNKLNSKTVQIRAKVVKLTPMIMGKNWIHLQDGSGTIGTNDLTITTLDETKVGDIVLVKGTISVNKDFGAGYKYEVIMNDAKIIK